MNKTDVLTDDDIHRLYDQVSLQEPYLGAITRLAVGRAIEQVKGNQ